MSFLKKLMVRGVRSFDPDNDQSIAFYSPLTIILGPNGAGKTTIIESLRYVTTGEHPPNSDKGKAFVHDPVQAKKNSIRGQVKLKFNDVSNENTIITRSMEVNLKKVAGKVQLSYKKLNEVILRKSKHIDAKCIDINVEMIGLIGVSKAVLTNVIFCHQEDSNWPLSEGKVLKERFDGIFGSKSYVDALEKIKKLRKMEKDQEKVLEAQLECAKEVRSHFEAMTSKRKTLYTNLNELKETNNSLQGKIAEIAGKLNDLRAKEDSIQHIQDKISNIQGKISEKERTCAFMKCNIKESFDGSEEELKSAIKNFTEDLEASQAEKKTLEKQLKEVESRHNELLKQQQVVSRDVGKMEEVKRRHDDLVNERYEIAVKLFSDERVNPDAGNFDINNELKDEDLNRIEEMISNYLVKLEESVNFENEKFKQEENNLLRNMDELQSKKSRIEAKIEQNKNCLSEKNLMLDEIKDKINDSKNSNQELSKLNKDLKECNKDLNQINISEIKSNFILEMKNFKIKSLKSQINELEEKIETLNELKRWLKKELEIMESDNANAVRQEEELSRIEVGKKKAENKLAIIEVESKERKGEELEKEIREIEYDNQSLVVEFDKLHSELNELKKSKDKLVRLFQNKQREIQNAITNYRQKLKEFKNINTKINDNINNGILNKAIELSQKYDHIKKEISVFEEQRKVLTENIKLNSIKINNSDFRRRELNDNLKVMDLSKEIEELTQILESEKGNLGFHDLSALKNEKARWEREEKKLEAEKQQNIGKQKPICKEISDIEDALRQQKYKKAETNFQEKLIELATCSIAGSDLNKYYQALDYAVTQFHQRKMQEINKLIEGFWKQSYRGRDIDYIKIVSEDEERNAEKRRNYNYRVVMVKDQTEMDMRGRCSAGQKVLASLIIRLALAEIFCANCSVLALDEPTTNLDKENISSFASAISDIVKFRSRMRSDSRFQMIIITHDEEFLNCLNEDTSQYYYKVYKDGHGFSKILRKSVKGDHKNDDEDQSDEEV